MANTTIALKQSGATGNTPSLGLLDTGELALNFADGILYFKTSSNTLGSIRTTQPSGLSTEVQFNDAGSFGGDSGFTYDKTTGTITVETAAIIGGMNVTSAVQSAFNQANTANNLANTKLAISGGTITGNLTVNGNVTVSANSFLDLSDSRIVNLADPINPGDAVNKSYLDGVQQGLLAKPSVRAATTGNLSAIYYNGPDDDGVDGTLSADTNRVFTTLDGVTSWSITTPPMGILIKNQTNPAHNGRYNLTSLGEVGVSPWVLTRCRLCDESDEIAGAYTFVQYGTVNKGTGWVQTVEDPSTFVIGTDPIIISQFSGAGTYTAGEGLTLSVTEFSISNTFQELVSSAFDTANAANSTDFTTVNVTPGTYGNATTLLSVTVAANGRLTNVTTQSFEAATIGDVLAISIALG